MPDKDDKKTTDQEQIDAQKIDAGGARPDDVSPTGPGGGGSDDGPSFEPKQIDPPSFSAGGARPDDVSPTGPGGGGPDDGPSFEPKQIDPQNIDAGATAPLDVGSESESPTSPSPPSIRVKVQGADLTGDTSDADT